MDQRAALSPGLSRQRSPSTSTVKRTQNVAAKAAAARLARVMATQTTDEDEDDDDFLSAGNGAAIGPPPPRTAPGANGLPAPLKAGRSPSPSLGRNFVDHAPPIRSTSVGRPSAMPVRPSTLVPPSKASIRIPPPITVQELTKTPTSTPFPIAPIEAPSRTSIRIPLPAAPVEESSRKGIRTPLPIAPMEAPSRTSFRIPTAPIEFTNKNERRSLNDGVKSSKEVQSTREASELRDTLDMLQEENDHILDKLCNAEARCGEAEARARELEKQVFALGEGVSLEARLLSRKEAALRQREAALKAASQNTGGREEELSVLRLELAGLKNESSATVDKLRDADVEAKALRSVTQRIILTEEEMEEVVLKRCWLARYWGLAIRYDVYPDIATSKHEHWASLAPLPFEVVISAGQKANEASWLVGSNDPERRYKSIHELNDVNGEGNIESMLSVEKGLRELASLKVEDAVVLAMANSRRPNFVQQFASDTQSHGDPKLMESYELGQEEIEDALFKQSWLTYFWRRATYHGLEEDIAEERLQFWIGRAGQTPSWHDVVDVERGLVELRKLGIEQQLWEVSRKEFDQISNICKP